MNLRRLTFEHLLYALIFSLALFVRFLNLGLTPLSDGEANLALQALQVARGGLTGGEIAVGPQPGYVSLTGALFALFGSTNFLARFWPALAGSILVLLPFLFTRPLERAGLQRSRDWRMAGMIMAAGMALDPGLVAVSRQATGPIMALSFGLLALGWWQIRRPILAGVFLGLALLSGPAILGGALGLGLAWAIFTWFSNRGNQEAREESETEPEGHPQATSSGNRQLALWSAGGTILLAGTLLFVFPQGLAAWFGSLPAYFDGWARTSGTPALLLILALVVYQPLALIFGLVSATRMGTRAEDFEISEEEISLRRKWIPFLALWALIGLILAMIYPSRQVSDLTWVLVPVWGLAALELARHFPSGEINSVSLVQAALLFILMALSWYTLAALNQVATSDAWAVVRLVVLVGVIALGVLTTVLVSLGWSWEAGRSGLAWGISSALLIYMISVMWGAAQVHPDQPQELWSPSPVTGQAHLFLSTLGDLSEWHSGLRHSIDIDVTLEAPSLRWVLRNYPNTRYSNGLVPGESASIVITRQTQESPALQTSYRGQDFSWWVRPGWQGLLPPDLAGWFAYREAPLQQDQIILWARSDLFPGVSTEQQNTGSSQP